jgi:multidrug efflux system membrane fusion protein
MTSRTAAVAGLALLLAAGGCRKNGPQGAFAPPPAPVRVAPAETRNVPLYFDEIGRAVAREVVTVRPQVSGRITEIHVADGADVKSGEALLTIDPRPYQARLEAAEAVLARERAALALAKVEFERVKELINSRAVSQQDFDARKSAVEVGEARVRESGAAVETARLDVEYCHLRSPIDGRAGHRLVDLGNIVEENKTDLLVLQRLDPIYADFTVAENKLATVKRNMEKGSLKVEVRLPDEPDSPLTGDLTFLDNVVRDATGTVKLRATVPNPDRRLWPGQFVKVRLVLSVIEGAVLVPAVAIQLSARGPYVFVVSKESTAEMRPVTVGQRQGDLIVVEKGVQPGEQVVTTIHPFLMPGGQIQVLPPPGEQGAKP